MDVPPPLLRRLLRFLPRSATLSLHLVDAVTIFRPPALIIGEIFLPVLLTPCLEVGGAALLPLLLFSHRTSPSGCGGYPDGARRLAQGVSPRHHRPAVARRIAGLSGFL